MPLFEISRQAEVDLEEIAAYTKDNWGWRQADMYLARLEEAFELLGRNPSLARSCEWIMDGLRRFEVGKHVVFYTERVHGILVVRVLHQRQLPMRIRFHP